MGVRGGIVAGLRRRPMVPVFVAYAVGTWWALCMPYTTGPVLLGACGVAVPLTCLTGRRRVAGLFALIVVGWSLAIVRVPQDRADATTPLPPKGSGTRIAGIVAGDPEKTHGGATGRATWSLVLRDVSWRDTRNRTVPISGPVYVRWYGPATVEPARYGDAVACRGRYVPPRPERANSYGGKLYTGYDNMVVTGYGHGSALRAWCYRQRRTAHRYLLAGIASDNRVGAVLDALLLGYRRRLGYHWLQRFARTGSIHVFAISGLHVGILGLLIALGLRWCRVPRTHWVVVMMPVLILYVLATGAKPSAVRACLMGIIYLLAPLLKREADALSTLAVAALLILLAVPADLLNISFILSFCVVTGLVVLYPVVWRLGDRLLALLPRKREEAEAALDAAFLPATDREPPAPGRVRDGFAGIRRYLASLVILTLCAWLSSTPLTAYYFHRLSLIALVTNIFVIPLTFVIVLLGCVSIVLGSLWLPLAAIVNNVNAIPVNLLLKVASAADAVPGGSLQIGRFPAWAVWLWFAVLATAAAVLHARLSPTPADNTDFEEWE